MVNFFWKFLGNMGTRIFFNRETKISLYLFGAMHHTMIDTVAELSDGKYEQAMDILIDLVKPLSEEMLSSILFETSVLGITFKNLISKFKDIKDFPYLLDLTLSSIWGKKWTKKIFNKTKFIPASRSDEKVDTYYIRLKSCPFCYPSSLPAEKLGRHRFGKFLTLTIETMTQIIQDFFGNDLHVVAREIHCFHRGDLYGEIRVWLYPRKNLQLMDSNRYIQEIK